MTSELDEISSKAWILRQRAIEIRNSDITNTTPSEVHQKSDAIQTLLPPIIDNTLHIPMNNLSIGNKINLVFIASVGLGMLVFLSAFALLPAAITILARVMLILLGIHGAYTFIFGITSSEIDFPNGTITQHHRFNRWFQPHKYKLSNYSIVTSSFVGRGPSWVSVYLSGVSGRLEIGKFDPGGVETKFDSTDAIKLCTTLATKLKIRDLGHL